MKIEDFFIDENNVLPYDCVACASERLRRHSHGNATLLDENYTLANYLQDMNIVFGDPTRGVYMGQDDSFLR